LDMSRCEEDAPTKPRDETTQEEMESPEAAP
jgi:hypothetical protein